MKGKFIVAFAVLAVFIASAATATSLGCLVNTSGNLTTYTYTLRSTELGDYIISLHLYAPLDPLYIKQNTGPSNWLFGAVIDPDPEVGTDIYWAADNPDTDGLANGRSLTFTLTVPSTCQKNDTYIVPGCFGNWGYETQNWAGDVVVSFPSVSVPESVPEPASLMAVIMGCGLMMRVCLKGKRK